MLTAGRNDPWKHTARPGEPGGPGCVCQQSVQHKDNDVCRCLSQSVRASIRARPASTSQYTRHPDDVKLISAARPG